MVKIKLRLRDCVGKAKREGNDIMNNEKIFFTSLLPAFIVKFGVLLNFLFWLGYASLIFSTIEKFGFWTKGRTKETNGMRGLPCGARGPEGERVSREEERSKTGEPAAFHVWWIAVVRR